MLTIGEFSRLCHVSARMLRHYDLLGLLRPMHIGAENGYRYYDVGQLTALKEIEAFKAYGFSLAEIRDLMKLDPAARALQMHRRRLRAHEELHALRRTIRKMEEEIVRMEGTRMNLDTYKVIVMQQPEQNVFAIRRTIHISETNALFEELLGEAQKLGYTRVGATQQMYMGEEFDYNALDIEAQVQVQETGAGVHTIPAGLYVATTHLGGYETLKCAYDAIADYLAAHPQYQVAGPGIERYIKDENTTANPEEMETGVLFPVVEVEK